MPKHEECGTSTSANCAWGYLPNASFAGVIGEGMSYCASEFWVLLGVLLHITALFCEILLNARRTWLGLVGKVPRRGEFKDS